LVDVPDCPPKLWNVVPPILVEVPDCLPKLWKVVPPILVEVPDCPPKLWNVVPPILNEVPDVPSEQLVKVVTPIVEEVQLASAICEVDASAIKVATINRAVFRSI
jgi:hypothetical protein